MDLLGIGEEARVVAEGAAGLFWKIAGREGDVPVVASGAGEGD